MLPYFTLTEISIGSVTLQVWGVFVVAGFVLALSTSLKEARRKCMDEEIIWSIMVLALLGMIIGGRIAYFFASSSEDILELVDPRGGFSLAGGAVLASVSIFTYLKHKKRDPWELFDLLTPGFIVALMFVRIGCQLVGDHVGGLTDLPWGAFYADGTVRHPVTLYEIIALSLILPVIFALRRKNKPAGYTFFFFCTFYAIFRLATDFLRCDDLVLCDLRFQGLTATQWILLFFLAPASFMAAFGNNKKRL